MKECIKDGNKKTSKIITGGLLYNSEWCENLNIDYMIYVPPPTLEKYPFSTENPAPPYNTSIYQVYSS